MLLLFTIRIDLLGQHKSIGCCQICVGRGDGQDQASVLSDELHQHIPDLTLNVRRLITNWDLGQAGQINESNIKH